MDEYKMIFNEKHDKTLKKHLNFKIFYIEFSFSVGAYAFFIISSVYLRLKSDTKI